MAKRIRVVLYLTEQENKALIESAKAMGTTIANVIRRALGYPLVKQGERKP